MKPEQKKSKNKHGKTQVSKQSVPEDLHGLEHEELSGHDEQSSLAASNTDEDEDEGLGDGNIGRSDRSILGK